MALEFGVLLQLVLDTDQKENSLRPLFKTGLYYCLVQHKHTSLDSRGLRAGSGSIVVFSESLAHIAFRLAGCEEDGGPFQEGQRRTGMVQRQFAEDAGLGRV